MVPISDLILNKIKNDNNNSSKLTDPIQTPNFPSFSIHELLYELWGIISL